MQGMGWGLTRRSQTPAAGESSADFRAWERCGLASVRWKFESLSSLVPAGQLREAPEPPFPLELGTDWVLHFQLASPWASLGRSVPQFPPL